MSDRFQIKRGDTSPSIKYELIPADITLAGASVRFQMENRARQTVIDRPATIDQNTEPPIVSYAWQQGDTDIAGDYDAEFRVEFSDGSIETFPNCGFISVGICRDIPDA